MAGEKQISPSQGFLHPGGDSDARGPVDVDKVSVLIHLKRFHSWHLQHPLVHPGVDDWTIQEPGDPHLHNGIDALFLKNNDKTSRLFTFTCTLLSFNQSLYHLCGPNCPACWHCCFLNYFASQLRSGLREYTSLSRRDGGVFFIQMLNIQ